ncbi:MAG: GNAT family N-acetyltransferase [Gammaproteobacteria bacterium]|nr:MAG: GNAT family N-acetyltransferase [Gammaproteobacteria bacterium]
MQIQFRAATEKDFADICGLIGDEDELFLVYPPGRFPFSVEQLSQIALVRKELTVAVDGPRIVGFANFYNYEASVSAFLGNVVVSRDNRRQGVGKQLVAYMLSVAFGRLGLERLHLSVFNHNLPALQLYAGFGFKPYDLEERRDPRGRTAVLLHFRLDRDNYVVR